MTPVPNTSPQAEKPLVTPFQKIWVLICLTATPVLLAVDLARGTW